MDGTLGFVQHWAQEVHATYETNRREATEDVLNQVAAAMRSVLASGHE